MHCEWVSMRTIGHVAEDMTGARGSAKPRNNELSRTKPRNNELSRTESGCLVAATHPADPEGVLAAHGAPPPPSFPPVQNGHVSSIPPY